MELYLQFGWGMMEHCRHFIRRWGHGSVILSPRDLTPNQLSRLGNEIQIGGGTAYLDPQFFLPHADHERLRSHSYWPEDYDSSGFWTGSGLAELLRPLLDMNQQIGCPELLLPGLLASVVDDDWLIRQSAIIEEGLKLNDGRRGVLATVALSEEAMRNTDQVDAVLDAAETWGVGGIYLVCEHPQGDYLVSDPTWVSNVMDLAAGLRLLGKRVIIGYCHHQMLLAACTGANAIASGTWMNVRSFPPEKFQVQYDEERKTRAIWYYCPQALSEFKVPFLDVAQRQGVLDILSADDLYGSAYADALFSAPRPSDASFNESDAFRHYLQCLHVQVDQAASTSFDATADAYERVLEQAAKTLERLHSVGVSGQLRDFGDIVAVNRAALSILKTERGAMLRRHWDSL